MVNYSRKDCIMMILAIEAGLDIPEVLFSVGASLQTGSYEMRERFAISSSIEEATHEKIGKSDILCFFIGISTFVTLPCPTPRSSDSPF